MRPPPSSSLQSGFAYTDQGSQTEPIQVSSLQHAQSCSAWDAEVSKLFQQTMVGLQRQPAENQQEELDLLQETALMQIEVPELAGQSHLMSEAGSECLQPQGLEFVNQGMSQRALLHSKSEALLFDLLHWDDAATALAVVTLPSVHPKHESTVHDLACETFPKLKPIRTCADPAKEDLWAGMVPVENPSSSVDCYTPFSPPSNSSGMASAWQQGTGVAAGWIPSYASGGFSGDGSEDIEGACVDTAFKRHCSAPEPTSDGSLPAGEGRVWLPSKESGHRQSTRLTRTPKWQDAYASVDETTCHSPSSNKSGSKLSPCAAPKKAGRKRLQVEHITLHMLQEQGLFDIPIQAAAQELGVGLSVLKRICRQIGLARWPFRTRQSLRGVIAKTELYLQAGDEAVGAQKAEVVQALQQTLNGLQGEAGQGLSESVRKYRQSVFKLNYKIKKNAHMPRLARPANLPAIPATAAAKMAAASASVPSSFSAQEDEGLADLDGPLVDPLLHLEEGWVTPVEEASIQ